MQGILEIILVNDILSQFQNQKNICKHWHYIYFRAISIVLFKHLFSNIGKIKQTQVLKNSPSCLLLFVCWHWTNDHVLGSKPYIYKSKAHKVIPRNITAIKFKFRSTVDYFTSTRMPSEMSIYLRTLMTQLESRG